MTVRDMRNIDQIASGHFRVRIGYRGETVGGVVATYEEAVQLRDEMKRQIVDGGLVPSRGASAKELRGRFLGSRNTNRSSDDDSSRWANHIATAAWAVKPVFAVTRADGVAWLRALQRKRVNFPVETHGEREVKFLGWQTRKHCLNLARAFFAWVIDEEKYGITENPFLGLTVAREDGDEDDGYQEGWYLDPAEQKAFLAMWNRTDIGLDEGDRMERWIVLFAIGTGLRKGEQWCLHLSDVFVDDDEPSPRIIVRFGSWDPVKQRYRSPKGRKGEKKTRVVYLHGLALEAARAWKRQLRIYAPKNPLGLMFPTERGARRSGANIRSWKKVVDAFPIIPRIGRKVWWHLLRHTCASSLVSGWWGTRWRLEAVSKVLGHTDIRTTQIYAHLAPSAQEEAAAEAHQAYLAERARKNVTALVTPGGPAVTKANDSRHARSDSNGRHPASKAPSDAAVALELARQDRAVTAIRHVVELVADGTVDLPVSALRALEGALDRALAAYALAERRARSGGPK